VDIVFFTGKLDGNIISLDWEVATETNLDRYEIERSFNGIEYSAIGLRKAEGRSSYSYNDNIGSYRGRRVYYRLKKIDKDGKFSYSPIFSLHIPLNTKFSIYPNPAGPMISLQLNSSSNETGMISVSDISGRVVYAKQVKAVNGIITYSNHFLRSRQLCC
jgi:hypothetical protein